MQKSNLWITLGMIVAVIVPIVLYAVLSVKAVEDGRYDELAQCLTEKGTKMYGAYWCAHCQAQEKMFGSSFEKINYVECALLGGQGQTEECKEAGIESYPTWEFASGERLTGEISLETLAEKAGCQVSE